MKIVGIIAVLLLLAVTVAGCFRKSVKVEPAGNELEASSVTDSSDAAMKTETTMDQEGSSKETASNIVAVLGDSDTRETIYFAGGCFGESKSTSQGLKASQMPSADMLTERQKIRPIRMSSTKAPVMLRRSGLNMMRVSSVWNS